MNEWQIVNTFGALQEILARNDFAICRDRDTNVVLYANKEPYAKDATIGRFGTLREALCFMQGYEQRIFEEKNK